MTYKINKIKGYLIIGKRILYRGYLDYLKEYEGQTGKLIENEINNKTQNLEKKLINN